jgi:anaerobic magnesium-protoporphyrin IX monomethyl ester cyclase
MSMKVLLVYPAFGERLDRFPSRPPLGLAYLAASLKDAGHECEIVDEQASERDLADLVESYQPQVVGFSVTTWAAQAVQQKIARLRARHPHLLYIVGGPHATALPEQMLAGGADVVVQGYGEEILLDLLQAIAHDRPLTQVAGISFLANGAVVTNKRATVRRDLDALPGPDYTSLDLSRYRWCSISSSRGCPMGCAFCSDSYLFGRKIRLRTPENFVRELEALHSDHNLRRFYFVDEQFTFDEQRVLGICELIQRKKLPIEWVVNSRVDSVTLDMLVNMRRAGCISVAFGVESGSDQILKTIHKGATTAQIERAIALVKEAGIRVKTSWIVGLPGDMTEQLKSIDLMAKTQPNHIDIYWLSLYPGTPFWNDAARYGIYFDPDDLPLTATRKMASTTYGYSYMSKAQVIEVAELATERMLRLGYKIADLEENDYDPDSRLIATFLRYLDRSTLAHELSK